MPLSAAGTALGLDSGGMGAGIPGAAAETADQKKKRLQALQMTQQRLGGDAGMSLSPAGAMLNLGGYGSV
jgi:hypothetical protein